MNSAFSILTVTAFCIFSSKFLHAEIYRRYKLKLPYFRILLALVTLTLISCVVGGGLLLGIKLCLNFLSAKIPQPAIGVYIALTVLIWIILFPSIFIPFSKAPPELFIGDIGSLIAYILLRWLLYASLFIVAVGVIHTCTPRIGVGLIG